MTHWNPAIITPYHKESLCELERCHKSCLDQSISCRHFMVADGHPLAELDEWDIEHIVLPSSHGDYGNTPRCIGAISAINKGFDPIIFLDADNWLSPEHAEQSLEAKTKNPSADIVASYRHLVLPDGTVIEPDAEDQAKRHIDTSCLAMFETSFFLIPLWATMTKPLSVIGDRVMFKAFQMHNLSIEWTGTRSLFYSTNYEHHWQRAGKKAPGNCYNMDMSTLENFSKEKLYAWSRLSLDLIK